MLACISYTTRGTDSAAEDGLMICDAVDGGCSVDGVEKWRRSEVKMPVP